MRQRYYWQTRLRRLELGRKTLIMGILNTTPDSFSDGGLYCSRDVAIARALQMEQAGADIIDIGGESTRPGSDPVTAEEEISRVVPVIEGLQGRLSVPISIDTTKVKVAVAALEAGAEIVNDISAMRFEPDMAQTIAAYGAGVCLMHTRGRPKVMQTLPPSTDIWSEIIDYLRQAVATALDVGVSREQICIDPGIGFGKTVEDNLSVIRELSRLEHLDLPILIGTSRKSFIAKVLGDTQSSRLLGTAATVVASILNGAHIVRVHDVAEMVEVARMADAIEGS